MRIEGVQDTIIVITIELNRFCGKETVISYFKFMMFTQLKISTHMIVTSYRLKANLWEKINFTKWYLVIHHTYSMMFSFKIVIPWYIIKDNNASHRGKMTSYGDIELSQHWVRWWLVAWRLHAILWTDPCYLSRLGLKLNHVSKRGSLSTVYIHFVIQYRWHESDIYGQSITKIYTSLVFACSDFSIYLNSLKYPCISLILKRKRDSR